MAISISKGREEDAFDYYPRLSRVKEYVIRNISEEIPLQKAANIAALEEKYFSAFFREKTGICFKNWLVQLRIKKAIEIMRQRECRVTQVCYSVGFQDLRTFERAFKRCKGVTPQEFKRTIIITSD